MRILIKKSMMRLERVVMTVMLTLITFSLSAQVTIGADTEPKATLDVVAGENTDTPVGVIAPRVTLSFLNSRMNAYCEDQKGAIVYVVETDAEGIDATAYIDSPGYYYFDGAMWLRFVIPDAVEIPSEPWRVSGLGIEATQNTENIYQNGQVTIGKRLNNSTPEPTAQLEISSSDKGFLVPRLDKLQISRITNPAEALLVWNTDEGCFNFWKGNKWKSMCGDAGEALINIGPFNCSESKIYGEYQVGVPTTGGNYLEVSLDVIEAGTYLIELQTGKGVFFQKSGTFSAPGPYTIQLPATGTPNESGTFTFPLTLNGEEFDPTCLKEIMIKPAEAEFQFVSSSCGLTAADKLVRGEASTGKTIQVKVQVLSAGTFSFYTDNVAGVKYSVNNVTLDEGVHDVVLYSNGNAPSEAGRKAFTVSGTGKADSVSDCLVYVDIEENDATITPNWSKITVNGAYRLDIETSEGGSNFIEIELTVGSTGNWVGVATNDEAGFSFSGNGTFSAGDVGSTPKTIRLYASGVPLVAGTLTFDLDINGNRTTVEVRVMLPEKNVLIVGSPSSSITNAIKNVMNFGPSGTSLIEKVNVFTTSSNPDANTLATAINNNKIDIIISGWSFDRSDDATSVIADFIKNKKGYFIYAQGQSQESNLKSILDKTYGTNISVTGTSFNSIEAVKLPMEEHPLLQGVFGDIRGRYVRSDDTGSWNGIVIGTEGPIKSFVETTGSGTGSSQARFLLNYTENFFYFSDWGTLNYTSSTYGSNSPISASSSATSLRTWDGNAVVAGHPIPAGESVGWILFGNIVDDAFNYTQKNLVKDYIVDTDYSK